MLCIGFQSFIYAWPIAIFEEPPEGAADMLTLRTILDGIREAALSLSGSPHSRRRQQAALRNLDAHLLKDIGITPEEASRGTAMRAASSEGPPRRLAMGRFYWNR
jgi:uncharacterized protein YjiS (DUF1127 family)